MSWPSHWVPAGCATTVFTCCAVVSRRYRFNSIREASWTIYDPLDPRHRSTIRLLIWCIAAPGSMSHDFPESPTTEQPQVAQGDHDMVAVHEGISPSLATGIVCPRDKQRLRSRRRFCGIMCRYQARRYRLRLRPRLHFRFSHPHCAHLTMAATVGLCAHFPSGLDGHAYAHLVGTW